MTVAAKRPTSQASDQKDSIDMAGIFHSSDSPHGWSQLGLALTIDKPVAPVGRIAISQSDEGADRGGAHSDEATNRFSQSTFSTDTKSRLRASVASQSSKQPCCLSAKRTPPADLGPSLDNALQYVYGDEIAREGEYNDGHPNARRRGRAIYVNDQLQFRSQDEMLAFHRALLDWQDGDEDRERICKVNDCDAIILLAQARNIAIDSVRDALDSPRKIPKYPDLYRPTSRRGAFASQLETSASTPEGALGRLKLAEETDADRLASNTTERLELLASDKQDGFCHRCQGPGSDTYVLRAGLRFALACYDDAMRERSKEHAAARGTDPDNTPTMNSSKPHSPQSVFRGQSIMKKLAKRRLSLSASERSILSPTQASTSPRSPMNMLSEAPPMYTSPRNPGSKGLASTFFENSAAKDFLRQDKERHLLQQERVKNAALEKELETIRAALNGPEKDAKETKESDKENEMLQAIAQAARDVAEAEESQGRWESQCEEVQMRLETIEEALYHALGLLAEKEEMGQGGPDKVDGGGRQASSDDQSGEEGSDNESHFYSAGEEDGEPTPMGTLTRKGGANLKDVRSRSEVAKTPTVSPQAQQDHHALTHLWPAFESGNETNGTGEASASPSHRSSISETNGSRRSSHASSAVRHTILPPSTPLPTSPLPNLPDRSMRAEGEMARDLDIGSLSPRASARESNKPKRKGNGTIIDYASRASLTRASQQMQTPEIDSSIPDADAPFRPRSKVKDGHWAELRADKTPGVSHSSSNGLPGRADRADHNHTDNATAPPSKMSISRSLSDFAKPTTLHSSPSIVSSNGSGQGSVNGSSKLLTRTASHRSGSSSNGREDKGVHASKMSILGHMPPMLTGHHSRTPSEFSNHSSSRQRATSVNDDDNISIALVSPAKSPLAEHYEALKKERAKDEQQTDFFARRTKFRPVYTQ